MDTSVYTYKQLAKKYQNFSAPAFRVEINGTDVCKEGAAIPEITIDIVSDNDTTGGCSFTVVNVFDPQKSSLKKDWMQNYFMPGKLVKVWMGYVKQKYVFSGFINVVKVNFNQGDIPTVDIQCIDAKGYLHNGKKEHNKGEKNIKQVVSEILQTCRSEKIASKVTVDDIPEIQWDLIQHNQTDFEFLVELANTYNYTFCTIAGEVMFVKPRQIGKDSPILTLKWGENLMSFERDMDITNQIFEVNVIGTDPDTNQPISGKSGAIKPTGTASKTPDRMVNFIRKRIQEKFDASVRTEKEARDVATAEKDAILMGFITGRGSCIGIPELIPCRFIKLEGMGPGIDNTYYINRVSHHFSTSGYTTTFQVRGNGE